MQGELDFIVVGGGSAGCALVAGLSEDASKTVLLTTAFRISSTCAMGRRDNPDAVVGPDLKMRGVEGLRVADASIIPVVVTSNLNAAAMMIGECAANCRLGRRQLNPSNEPYWVNPNWQTNQQ